MCSLVREDNVSNPSPRARHKEIKRQPTGEAKTKLKAVNPAFSGGQINKDPEP